MLASDFRAAHGAIAGMTVLYTLAWLPGLLRQPSLVALAVSLLLVLQLAMLAGIDLVLQRLPNELNLALLVSGLVATAALAPADLPWHAVGAISGYASFRLVALAYRTVRGRDGLGGGDAKLLAASGAWVGLAALPSVLLIACGTALASVIASRRLRASTDRIAFGPFLALGCWLTWLYGSLS